MAMADVLVLRSTPADGGPDEASAAHRPPRRPDPALEPSSDTGDTTPTPDDEPWPRTWLPWLLGDTHEEETVDGVVHRYRGARLLHGCRSLHVTASPTDPTSVRLTIVWTDDAPSDEDRAAAVSWCTAQAAARGWRPRDRDDVVGSALVEQYVPAEALAVESGVEVVLHDLEWVSGRETGRTSGRRT